MYSTFSANLTKMWISKADTIVDWTKKYENNYLYSQH